jgi:hypothetical protein
MRNITNAKEVKMMRHISGAGELPEELFDAVCDPLIDYLASAEFDLGVFREKLYDILVNNLDVVECFWRVFSHFILSGCVSRKDIATFMPKVQVFLKQYNNNYRPIYHLESIFFSLRLMLGIKGSKKTP